MKRSYRFVPACPRCGSDQTGYYIFSSTKDEEALILVALKKGELARVKNSLRSSSEPNCFCAECNMEWYGKIETLRLSKDEVDSERELRRTSQSPVYNTAADKKSIKNEPKSKRIIKKILYNLKPF